MVYNLFGSHFEWGGLLSCMWERLWACEVIVWNLSFQARRALRALRGLVRLKSLIEGQSVKRQSATTLRCMQTLARVQSQIRARRLRMSEENQALQRQLQQKHEKELEKLRVSFIFIHMRAHTHVTAHTRPYTHTPVYEMKSRCFVLLYPLIITFLRLWLCFNHQLNWLGLLLCIRIIPFSEYNI